MVTFLEGVVPCGLLYLLCLFVDLFISHLCFCGGNLVLIVHVSSHWLLFAFKI